jgi:hypothetical protein
LDKIQNNPKLSNEEKIRKLVLIDGILNIDQLIALDNFDIYIDMINQYPTTEVELCQQMVKNEEYDKLLEWATKNSYYQLAKVLKNKKYDKLSQIINKEISDSFNNQRVNNSFPRKELINSKYIDYSAFKHHNTNAIGKDSIEIESIINHKDIRFFKYFVTHRVGRLNYALNLLLKDRPDDIEIHKILFDAGAFISLDSLHDNSHVYKYLSKMLNLQITGLINKKKEN